MDGSRATSPHFFVRFTQKIPTFDQQCFLCSVQGGGKRLKTTTFPQKGTFTMPTWRNQLPPEGKNAGYDLRRTPATGAIQAIITCEDLVVCDTHYWHGRTLPCERITNDEGKTIDDIPCPACREKAAWRTHVYVSCFDSKKREHFLFECTTMAAKPLAEYRQSTGTLRGCVLHASRPKGIRNAKVVIETNVANLARSPIPNAPDIQKCLAIIWRVPLTGLSHQLTHEGETTIKAHADRLTEMREQPDNAVDMSHVGPIHPEIDKILCGEHAGNGKHHRQKVAR
jgi:hypothetical protein